MNKVQTISFLAIVILSAGCNEKVSPDLANASATTPDSSTPDSSTTTTSTSGYSFKLVNKADPIYGFQLHKTGLGNADGGGVGACEIKTTSKDDKFSHKTFAPTANSSDTNPERDITCYMDAEEFSLYFGGLSFEIQASADACEYISYSPFSYYNRQPGDSSGSYTKITCAEGTTDAQVDVAFGATSPVIATSGDNIGCDEYASGSIAATTRNKFIIDREEKLCRFNYTDGAKETCDIGTITINEYVVTFDKAKAEEDAEVTATATAKLSHTDYTAYTSIIATPTAPNDGTAEISDAEFAAMQATTEYQDEYNTAYAIAFAANSTNINYTSKSNPTTKTIKCGGKPGKCIRGPIVQHKADEPRWYLNTMAAKGTALSVPYSYPSLMPDRMGTFIYANFRRDLAIEHKEFSETDPEATLYQNFFSATTTVINPKVMELLARNRNEDGTVFKASGVIPLYENNTFTAKPLAAEAYVGIGYSNYTNPFYTFECLDKAREPMARIRMLVREWDRIFPVTAEGKPHSDLELISDIYKTGTTDSNDRPRQDIYGTQDGGNYGDWDDWNDFLDWDDIFWLYRTEEGVLEKGSAANYFDKESAFPNEIDEEN